MIVGELTCPSSRNPHEAKQGLESGATTVTDPIDLKGTGCYEIKVGNAPLCVKST